MKKRTLFASLISTVAIALCFIFSSTGAWFSHNIVLEDSLDGETEGAYFAYGDGSESSPYGITNARHLYNLAWLQYLGRFNKDNDNDGKLDTVYFELGDDIDMEGYTALPPIGTTKYPFIGNFTGLTAHNTIDSSQNGKCHTISNLTVTNNYSQYTYHATTAQESDFGTSSTSVTQIVGFFGVVGSYNGSPSDATYDSSANSITNVGLEGLTVQTVASSTLIGLVAGYVNGTISGVPVNNSYIDIANKSASYIDTSMTDNLSDYSLIGYAANDDYLRILQSSETTADIPEVSNPLLSQGGDEWGGSIDMKTMYNNLFNNKLTSAKSKTYTDTYTTHEEEVRTGTLDSNNNIQPTSEYQPITDATTTDTYEYSYATTGSSSNGYYHYYLQDTGADSQNNSLVTASYTLIQRSGDTASQYIGLSGREELKSYTYTKDSTTHVSGTFYYISSESSGIYLSANKTGIISEENKESSQVWIISSSGYIFTYLDGDTSTRYYLAASGSSLILSNTASTKWEWDDTNKTYKTGSYYLYYDNNSSIWALTSSLQTTSTYYTISSNGNYLLANGTSGINQSGTTSESSATHWYFENGSYGYLYTLANDIKYYVTVSSNWGNISISLSTSSSSSCIARNTSSTNFLSCTIRGMFSSRTYYLYYYSDDWDGSYWTAGTNNNSVTITSKTETIDNSLSSETISSWDITRTTSETRSLTSYPTYYPLTWADDTLTNPSEKNTGYVIGGSYYDSTNLGDVRLSSHYRVGYLSNSGQDSGSYYWSGNKWVDNINTNYDKSKLYPYTFNSNGSLVKIGDPINGYQDTSGYTSYSDLGLSKYYYNLAGKASGSRVSLDSMLGTGTAYGLHFMNADITSNHKITVPYVMVNGTEYYNYELPEDAIDFNLKTGGLINFFAHTGYINYSSNYNSWPYEKTNTDWDNSNNCFFSLHWIDRDGEKINNIKQIAGIYNNKEYDSGNSLPRYVYTYRDSSDNEVTSYYDTGVKDSNGNIIKGTKGDKVFDTYWLTDPDYNNWVNYAAYYFEVPVNKGEYALGSCSGYTDTTKGWESHKKNGAYLMYLDIGASLKNTNAITIDEHWETKDSFYEYPLGTDFKDIESLNDTFSSVQGGESAAIIVSTSSKGEKIQFTYTESTSVTTTKSSLVVGPDSGGSYKASYKTINTSATIRGSPSTEIEAVPIESHTTAYDRETLYDMTSGKEGTDGTTYDTSSTTTITTHVGESDETTVKSDAITGTITLSTDEISQIVNVSFEDEETDRTLFTVEYCGAIGSKDTPLEIELSYNSVTHTYTLNFVTSETNPSNAIIRFTTLNTTFTPTVDGKESTPINYNVVVQNNGVDNNQIGQVTEDTFYTIVPNQKSSS